MVHTTVDMLRPSPIIYKIVGGRKKKEKKEKKIVGGQICCCNMSHVTSCSCLCMPSNYWNATCALWRWSWLGSIFKRKRQRIEIYDIEQVDDILWGSGPVQEIRWLFGTHQQRQRASLSGRLYYRWVTARRYAIYFNNTTVGLVRISAGSKWALYIRGTGNIQAALYNYIL